MKYVIKLPKYENKPVPALDFHGESPEGKTLGVTKKYFTKNGEPWFPIMGEFHFSRYPHRYWEEELLKMKAGGIQIVATYIFWIHHEEQEGQFNWEGRRNLGQFVKLCQKCGLDVFLRIGPWSHGECRNGGFPDWLLTKGYELRSDDPSYMALTRKFYMQIYNQVKGLFFKEGGPIIGTQIENEYGHAGGFDGEKGEAHMRNLTALAKVIGFDTPYYTATGWGGAVIGDNLPVMGAYVDAPWSDSPHQLPLNHNFIFSDDRNDEGIGSDYIDPITGPKIFSFDPLAYPYATAELGGGLMVTKDRRPIASAKDTEVMVFTRIASGANLIGYYMYHGGTHPVGELSTFNESKKTGSPCDLPILTYDFQGIIGEYGKMHESFHTTRLQHLFLTDFGKELATSDVYFPDFNPKNPEDFESLRMSIRHKVASGYVFLNNYQRHGTLPDRLGLNIQIEIDDETITFPTIDLPTGQNIALPFNLTVHQTLITYATAQPLCLLNDDTIVFWNEVGCGEYLINETVYTGTAETRLKVGNLNIITLTRKAAEHAWKIRRDGRDELIFHDGFVIEKEATYVKISLSPHPLNATFQLIKKAENGDKFYQIHVPDLFMDHEDDVYLTLDFSGLLANLFLDGKLVADWFYTGLDWQIGLKRFKDDLKKEMILQVKPVEEKAPIYMEILPTYTDGIACELHGVKLTAEYSQNI